jgi:hypothetical protein
MNIRLRGNRSNVGNKDLLENFNEFITKKYVMVVNDEK